MDPLVLARPMMHALAACGVQGHIELSTSTGLSMDVSYAPHSALSSPAPDMSGVETLVQSLEKVGETLHNTTAAVTSALETVTAAWTGLAAERAAAHVGEIGTAAVALAGNHSALADTTVTASGIVGQAAADIARVIVDFLRRCTEAVVEPLTAPLVIVGAAWTGLVAVARIISQAHAELAAPTQQAASLAGSSTGPAQLVEGGLRTAAGLGATAMGAGYQMVTGGMQAAASMAAGSAPSLSGLVPSQYGGRADLEMSGSYSSHDGARGHVAWGEDAAQWRASAPAETHVSSVSPSVSPSASSTSPAVGMTAGSRWGATPSSAPVSGAPSSGAPLSGAPVFTTPSPSAPISSAPAAGANTASVSPASTPLTSAPSASAIGRGVPLGASPAMGSGGTYVHGVPLMGQSPAVAPGSYSAASSTAATNSSTSVHEAQQRVEDPTSASGDYQATQPAATSAGTSYSPHDDYAATDRTHSHTAIYDVYDVYDVYHGDSSSLMISLPNGDVVEAPNDIAARAIRAALSQLGVPYVWGGTTPGVGLDCSGLTQWSYQQAGLDIGRTTWDQDDWPQIDPGLALPGDLIIWDGHVAMFLGNGMMVEAGDPVAITPVRTENCGMAFEGIFRPWEGLRS